MYEIFEHTADVGIRVRADSLAELFADAARGLFSIMVASPDAVRTVETAAFDLRGDNIEELLHDWLAELLYTFAAKRIVLSEFQVRIDEDEKIGEESNHADTIAGPLRLTATARGEPIDLKRHEIDVEVKAITWHGFSVKQQDGRWVAEVIVDI